MCCPCVGSVRKCCQTVRECLCTDLGFSWSEPESCWCWRSKLTVGFSCVSVFAFSPCLLYVKVPQKQTLPVAPRTRPSQEELLEVAQGQGRIPRVSAPLKDEAMKGENTEKGQGKRSVSLVARLCNDALSVFSSPVKTRLLLGLQTQWELYCEECSIYIYFSETF